MTWGGRMARGEETLLCLGRVWGLGIAILKLK
jgi:hypothetical protein